MPKETKLKYLSLLVCLGVMPQSVRATEASFAVKINGKSAHVTGTASLKQSVDHSLRALFDKDAKSAWCVRSPKGGIGSNFHIEFDAATIVHGFRFLPGYLKSTQSMRENLSPKSFKVEIDGFPALAIAQTALRTENNSRDEDPAKFLSGAFMRDDPSNSNYRYVLFDKPKTLKSMVVGVDAVYATQKYADMCFSEFDVWYGDDSKDEAAAIFRAVQTIANEKGSLPVNRDAMAASNKVVASMGNDKRVKKACMGDTDKLNTSFADLRAKYVNTPIFVHKTRSGWQLFGGILYSDKENSASDYVECRPVIILDAKGRPTSAWIDANAGSNEL